MLIQWNPCNRTNGITLGNLEFEPPDGLWRAVSRSSDGVWRSAVVQTNSESSVLNDGTIYSSQRYCWDSQNPNSVFWGNLVKNLDFRVWLSEHRSQRSNNKKCYIFWLRSHLDLKFVFFVLFGTQKARKVPRKFRAQTEIMGFQWILLILLFFAPQTGEAKNIEPDLRAQTPYRNSVRQHPGAMYKDDKNKI